jgi:hypothetical protein
LLKLTVEKFFSLMMNVFQKNFRCTYKKTGFDVYK